MVISHTMFVSAEFWGAGILDTERLVQTDSLYPRLFQSVTNLFGVVEIVTEVEVASL